MNHIISGFILASYACFTVACEKEYIHLNTSSSAQTEATDTSSTDTSGTTETSTVKFTQDIVPILKNRCLRCHDSHSKFNCTASAAYSTIVSGGYVNTSDPEKSKFFTKPNSGHADSYLLTAEHDKIVTWIKEGAKNN